MKLIVGLGNPGTKYAGTRHNVGFSVIVGLADKYNIELSEKKHKAIYGRGMIEGEKVILAMPQTFMNLSGESVRELVDYYKCDPSDVIVAYDDIDLAVGKLRIREKGSAGGHNGSRIVWILQIMYYPDLEKMNFRRSRQAVIMPVMRSH